MRLIIHTDDHFYILLKVTKYSMNESMITIHQPDNITKLEVTPEMSVHRLPGSKKILEFIGAYHANKDKE